MNSPNCPTVPRTRDWDSGTPAKPQKSRLFNCPAVPPSNVVGHPSNSRSADRVTAGQTVFQNNLVHRKWPMPADAVPVWELGNGS